MRFFALLVLFAFGFHPEILASTEVTRFHVSDRLSQSSILLDDSGNVVSQERVSSFGAVESSSRESEEWQSSYHGKLRNRSSGLVSFGVRLYDPEIGRFITMDPRGFKQSAPESFNRYAFSNNNPYRYTDPDGRAVETFWDVANVGIGAHSLVTNVVTGNWSEAGEDALGLAFDALASAIPFVPGGAASALKAERAISSVSTPVKSAGKVGDDGAKLTGGSDLDSFEKASEYGIKAHKEMIKAKKGTGLDSHHLAEQRFADILGIKPRDMNSVALTKQEHQVFTNAWRNAIPYGSRTRDATVSEIKQAAESVYSEFPTLLEYALKNIPE